jgi:ABC-type phosphate transport system substrate-binding protein
MLKRRPRLSALVLGLLAVATAGVVAAATSNAAPKEQPLHGQMRNIVQHPCGSATGVCSSFEASGSIHGDGLVSVDTYPDAANLGFSKAHTVIHTKKGDLTCHEAALFDLPGQDHAFVDLCLIDGGTGDYAGATGYIQEVGTFDFAANVGQLDYYGKLIRS